MRVQLASIVAAGVVALSTSATATTFSPGSLIIPVGAAYQDDCGAVSAYGLVYDVLRANAWLQTNKGKYITIHYAYLTGKTSVNRCVPTNLDTPPTGTWTTASWNDGCDFRVYETSPGTTTPVSLIDNTAGTNRTKDTNVVTFNYSESMTVYPTYTSRTIQHTVTAATDVYSVGYLGGPFIIDSTDAALFEQLLEGSANGGFDAKDSQGNTIDFSPFRTGKTSAGSKCNGGSFGTSHYVNIHYANISFTATVGRDFTTAPPRLALLGSDTGNKSVLIYNNILQAYLTNAGLNFATAGGCPSSGINCGSGTQGQIYDLFDVQDIANGRLANTTSGSPTYKMLWMPHWEHNATLNSTESSAMTAINTFLSGQAGLAAECASVAGLEGDYLSSPATNYQKEGLQLMTCKNNGSGGCSATVNSYGIKHPDANPFFFIVNDNGFGTLRNCSDPNMSAGSACMYYPAPDDPYVQVADYEWDSGLGNTAFWTPNSTVSQIYQSGVIRLASHVSSFNSATFTSSPTSLIDYDLATRTTTGSSNVLYLGGHDDSGTVAQTKVILETLLQLGTAPTSTTTTSYEVSRSAPTFAQINGTTAIVQGTYTTPTATAKTISNHASVSSWTFPYETGHMRARTASTITTTASSFASGTILFDTASTTGCGGGSCIPPRSDSCATPLNGSCRYIFTNTNPAATSGSTFHPTTTPMKDSNATTIVGSLMCNGACNVDVTTTDYQTIQHTILTSSLGGVDHSGVAVIQASTYTSSTNRPTMAYFAGMDGMLHAVCASTVGTTTSQPTSVCPYLGTELWAFMPRVQLPLVRTNDQRMDGSVHVVDAFGDFTNNPATGAKSWHTILVFQTGYSKSGIGSPAAYALDVTDPATPVLLWEYTTPLSPTVTAQDFGTGLISAVGPVIVGGAARNLAVLETNNGGTASATAPGVVTTALYLETGTRAWQFSSAYSNTTVPTAATPGGAVGVDLTGNGYFTDFLFGDLYGWLWRAKGSDGTNALGTNPLFEFTFNTASDEHPIGSPPAIYSDGSSLYAAFASGGYTDMTNKNTTFSKGSQYLVSVKIKASTSPVLDTGSACNNSSCDMRLKVALDTGTKGYSQPTIVGNQMFVTSDSADVNSDSYGGSATGHVLTINGINGTSTNASYDSTTVYGGASSLAVGSVSGTTVVIGSSSDKQVQLGTAALTASGTGVAASSGALGAGIDVAPSNQNKISRSLWLRTQ